METATVDAGWLLLFLVCYFVVRHYKATLRGAEARDVTEPRRLAMPLAAPVEFAADISDTAKIRLVHNRQRPR